ncbi:hypothetical protein ES705_22616 [subsurface metagenome]
MVKLKNPFMSFTARGKLGNITFLRRRRVNLAEKTPVVPDAKSDAQVYRRTVFQACVDLWHLLEASEKAAWETLGTAHHMTGYAWYLSQCMRPNPLIFLPLAGGTMKGDIDMDGHAILNLPPAYAAIEFVIDGSGAPITLGQKGHLEVPFGCEIVQVTILADQDGAIKIDIWGDLYANFPPDNADTICGGNEPEIAATGQKYQDATLAGWTTALALGSILAFNVDSCATITRVTLSLIVRKS